MSADTNSQAGGGGRGSRRRDRGRGRIYSGDTDSSGGRGRGRPAGRGRGSRGRSSPRYTFSTVRMQQLERIFEVSYTTPTIPMVQRAPTPSSLRLRSKLKGHSSDEEWERVCERYTALFSIGEPEPECVVPPLLLPIFHYLAASKAEKVNMFSNGAGKVLMLHLLTLLLLKVNIRVATTSDPRHDWCGINLPPISGVVDVTLFHGGRHHMLGEVKADSATGTTQVLAAMQAVATNR